MSYLSICKIFGSTALAMLLFGCTMEHKVMVYAQSQAEIKTAVEKYENQLVLAGKAHAILSAQPRPIDESAIWSPYRLSEIDGKKIISDFSNFMEAKPLPRDFAFSELKIPPGQHDLVIIGGAIRAYRTSFSKVTFNDGKRYAIVEELSPDETITVHISEYRQDRRFAPIDKEYYVIGKRVSDAVERGSSTVVSMEQVKQ